MENLRRALFSTIPRVLKYSTVAASLVSSRCLYRPILGSVPRFYSSDQPMDFDLSNEESKRRICNRLLYRSKQRGFLELDLVLGKWVEEHVHSMDEKRMKALVDVLDLENPDLWKWLSGQEQAPEAVSANPVFTDLHQRVMNNLNRHSALETRATLGQTWVRGWDDFKKGRDGPVVGNQ